MSLRSGLRRPGQKPEHFCMCLISGIRFRVCSCWYCIGPGFSTFYGRTAYKLRANDVVMFGLSCGRERLKQSS